MKHLFKTVILQKLSWHTTSTKYAEKGVYLFWVSVEVQVDHDLPWVFPTDCTTETQYFTGKQPPHQTNRLRSLKHTQTLTMYHTDIHVLAQFSCTHVVLKILIKCYVHHVVTMKHIKFKCLKPLILIKFWDKACLAMYVFIPAVVRSTFKSKFQLVTIN